MTRRISGSSTNSPRKHTDAIGRALKDAGVAHAAPDPMFTALTLGGVHPADLLGGQTMHFKDYPINWTEAERG